MTIPLFDAQCGFLGFAVGARSAVGREELLNEMSRVDIARALVRAVPEDREGPVPFANRRLYEACRDQPELVPCPAVAPNGAGDLAPEAEQIDEAVSNGAGAVWIRPGCDYWTLEDWCSKTLFEALETRRMPVVCLARMVSMAEVADLARRYPGLPLIYAEADYRSQRTLVPLLRACPNVRLSIGNNYDVHRGVEQIVSELGPQRLVFGTGFPAAEPMAAVTMLMYADIADRDKALIGAGNMERLMRDIQS